MPSDSDRHTLAEADLNQGYELWDPKHPVATVSADLDPVYGHCMRLAETTIPCATVQGRPPPKIVVSQSMPLTTVVNENGPKPYFSTF